MLDEILWQQNTHLAEACLHHPFVRGLADGTLYPEAFRRYVAQDAFFLNAFARAYALAAARSQDGETLISLCELLNGVLRELQLHAGYAKELKIKLARVQPYRQVEAYTDFLLDGATSEVKSAQWMAEAGRNARRSRFGGNDARAAPHGAAIRGLHGSLPRPWTTFS